MGFYGHDVARRRTIVWDAGIKKFSTTTRATIAKAVIAVLAKPTGTANQYLCISPFEITMNEFIAALENVTGMERWDIEHVKGEEQIKLGRELMAQDHMWQGLAKLALAVAATDGTGNDFATDEKLANEMLGLPKEELDDVVARVLNEGS